MMATVYVLTTYTIGVETPVELPEGKTEADIQSAYVKWGEVHIFFKDETELQLSEAQLSWEDANFKSPDSLEIRKDDNGYASFEDDGLLFSD